MEMEPRLLNLLGKGPMLIYATMPGLCCCVGDQTPGSNLACAEQVL